MDRADPSIHQKDIIITDGIELSHLQNRLAVHLRPSICIHLERLLFSKETPSRLILPTWALVASYPSTFVFLVSYVLPSPEFLSPGPWNRIDKTAKPASDYPQVLAYPPRLRILLDSAPPPQQRWPRNYSRLTMRSVARSSCSNRSGLRWGTQALVLIVGRSFLWGT